MIAMSSNKFKINALTIFFILAFLLVWEFVIAANPINHFLFSKPSDVFTALKDGIQSKLFINDFCASATTTTIGALFGVILSLIISSLTFIYPIIIKRVEIVIGLLASLPILAIAPMFLVWFGTGLNMKIAIATFLVFLLATREIFEAKKECDNNWSDFKKYNSGQEIHFLTKILFPLTMSRLFTKIPEIVNISFLGVFIGEFIAADRGLGYRVLRAGGIYQVDVVLAAAILSVLSLLLIQYILSKLSVYLLHYVENQSISKIIK